MKGIVWYYNDKKKAIKQLKRIIERYEDMGIQVYNVRYNLNTIFMNNDSWQIVKAGDNARGMRTNISYIDENILLELIDLVIKPCTIAFPYSGFNYY